MDRITAKGASDMPTAAKAVGAAAMALVGWGMTEIVHFRHPDFADPGIPHLFFAAVGLFVGWRYPGKAAVHGYLAAWKGGITGAFVGYLAAALLAACYAVWHGIDRNYYKTMNKTLDAFVTHFVEFGVLLFDGPVIVALFVGGLLAGVFAGFAGRLWN